ncbi:hypothetical protein [Streptomyces rugosispiralis]|uniref:Uncharacterized protein n=1 Tax=Streptomyces rugosispiralis TaxID=2967341 RepID=A0ABT1V392_9ACTN|nr:hypothetical protein [Streptomyces rugosispiralis]MCQ8191831.1 hypothetical protein [Streptomyces rugosispiralis]
MTAPHSPAYQEYYTRTPLQLVDQARLTAAVQAFAPQVQLRVHPVHRERPGQGGAVGRGSGASIFDILP